MLEEIEDLKAKNKCLIKGDAQKMYSKKNKQKKTENEKLTDECKESEKKKDLLFENNLKIERWLCLF